MGYHAGILPNVLLDPTVTLALTILIAFCISENTIISLPI